MSTQIKLQQVKQTFFKRGGIKEDRENFVNLVKSLKKRFTKRNKLVTAAIGASSAYIKVAYTPMAELCK